MKNVKNIIFLLLLCPIIAPLRAMEGTGSADGKQPSRNNTLTQKFACLQKIAGNCEKGISKAKTNVTPITIKNTKVFTSTFPKDFSRTSDLLTEQDRQFLKEDFYEIQDSLKHMRWSYGLRDERKEEEERSKKAARLFWLGLCYNHGVKGIIDRDAEKAFKLCLHAAQQGCPEAQELMSSAYITGACFNRGLTHWFPAKNLDTALFYSNQVATNPLCPEQLLQSSLIMQRIDDCIENMGEIGHNGLEGLYAPYTNYQQVDTPQA